MQAEKCVAESGLAKLQNTFELIVVKHTSTYNGYYRALTYRIRFGFGSRDWLH